MARPLIASKLIKSVRDRALIPTDTSTYQDSDILDILNEEVTQGLLATIMSLNEEHMVTHIDIDAPENLSTEGVTIPERAVGNKLRDVAYLRGGNVFEVSRTSLEELSDYRHNSYTDLCYVEGDQIKFTSNQIQADKIRIYFYLTPNDIVSEDECGKIFSINDNGNQTTSITMVEFPENFTNLPIMDFVGNSNPNKIKGFDASPISVNRSTKTVTFNNTDIPNSLKVGDYVCEQYTSPYLNLPTEMEPLLAQRAAVFFLEAINDTEGLKNAMMRLGKMETSVQTILESRIEGAPQKINARHNTLMQSNGLRRGRGRY